MCGIGSLNKELRDNAFPVTIVRPSFTYDETVIPLSFNSWTDPYTVIDRMRKGQPVIIPGDGTSLWQLTHNADFAIGLLGLFGHQASIGHAFHITTDEVLNWNQIFEATAEAARVDTIDAVHIASDFIVAWYDADPARRTIDEIANANYDKLIAGYRKGLDETRLSFVKAV